MTKGTTLTQAELKAEFSYSPETGLFTRIGRPCLKVGTTTDRGYVRIQVGKSFYRAHRLAWLYVTGEFPAHEIDHINGDRADNRFVNLREAKRAENLRNMRVRKNSCGAKGVYRGDTGYRAYIVVSGESISLGTHPTVDEAAHAYNKAAIQHFGEFACLNPVGQPSAKGGDVDAGGDHE